MPADRQQHLLAVLMGRGPAHPADLAWHPVLRDRYHLANRFDVRDDLEALVDEGEVEAYRADVDGETTTVAYDVIDVDRPNWDARIQRAEKVVREHRRRKARRERHGLS